MKAYYVMLDFKKVDVILGGYDTNVIMNGHMTFSDIEKTSDKKIIFTSEKAHECLEFIKVHFPQYKAHNPISVADMEYELFPYGRGWRKYADKCKAANAS